MSDVPDNAWEARLRDKDERIADLRREVDSKEAELARARGRYEEAIQAEQQEKREIREMAERNQRDLDRERRDTLEAERERNAAEVAQLLALLAQQGARQDAVAPALADIAACQRFIAAHLALKAALKAVADEEWMARARVLHGEGTAHRALEQQWIQSLGEVQAVAELRCAHLGNGPASASYSCAAGEGLYNLLVALRSGGPVDRPATRELLKGETNVTTVWYGTHEQGSVWSGTHFAIPAAEAYELASTVLCHLPALQDLGFCYLPPLSTLSLEWAAHLPPTMKVLQFLYTPFTVADLRELHRHRGDRTFEVTVNSGYCTHWGEFAAVGNMANRKNQVKAALGGMMDWYD